MDSTGTRDSNKTTFEDRPIMELMIATQVISEHQALVPYHLHSCEMKVEDVQGINEMKANAKSGAKLLASHASNL